MDREEIIAKANQLLQELAALRPIQPSDEWEQKLFLNVSKAGRKKSTGLVSLKGLALIIFFVLINALAVLQYQHEDRVRTLERKQLLQDISDQLLIRSTASN